jgi:hypothetical protein
LSHLGGFLVTIDTDGPKALAANFFGWACWAWVGLLRQRRPQTPFISSPGDGSRDFPEGTRLFTPLRPLEAKSMTVKTQKLLHQVRQAQQTGKAILTAAGLADLDLIYVFATATTLVINCRDCATLWKLDDAQIELRQAIHRLGLDITNIWVERNGHLAYDF